jgi:hypothetical protein
MGRFRGHRPPLGRSRADGCPMPVHGVPLRILRDEHVPDLHTMREGAVLLSLLRAERRGARGARVVLRANTLPRWFRARFGLSVKSLIAHPSHATLARFILEAESVAPDAERVVSDLIESLYEFGSGAGATATDQSNGPMVLMTAHRAKGLEFDHVLILDGGGWTQANDAERRLFYVAMTRARKTLTVCERWAGSTRSRVTWVTSSYARGRRGTPQSLDWRIALGLQTRATSSCPGPVILPPGHPFTVPWRPWMSVVRFCSAPGPMASPVGKSPTCTG